MITHVRLVFWPNNFKCQECLLQIMSQIWNKQLSCKIGVPHYRHYWMKQTGNDPLENKSNIWRIANILTNIEKSCICQGLCSLTGWDCSSHKRINSFRDVWVLWAPWRVSTIDRISTDILHTTTINPVNATTKSQRQLSSTTFLFKFYTVEGIRIKYNRNR